jgi:hypothetical protein
MISKMSVMASLLGMPAIYTLKLSRARLGQVSGIARLPCGSISSGGAPVPGL